MAVQTKVAWAQLRVGILAIVALFFVALLVFLLTGNTKFFVKQLSLYTYVDDAAGLQEGAPVRLNGILAGKVKDVMLSGSNDPRKTIRVDFLIDEPMINQIPEDSLITIASDNLLGATKFLNIRKGKSPDLVKPGSEVHSLDTREFDELVQQGYAVLDSMQAILTKVDGVIAQVEVGKGTIGKLLVDESLYRSLESIAGNVQTLAATLNSQHGTLGKLINTDEFYDEAHATLTKLNKIADEINAGKGTAGKFLKDPKLYDDLSKSVNQLQAILDDLNAGKGTAGMILKDPKIANQVSLTLDKVNTTIDRMNSGQGTIGQLLVNPQLYDSANGATRELHELLKDFRANPKKFLRIKLAFF
jgi:phospholipid/cholesterol/gamma-HCH transport system substrate-binding protein